MTSKSGAIPKAHTRRNRLQSSDSESDYKTAFHRGVVNSSKSTPKPPNQQLLGFIVNEHVKMEIQLGSDVPESEESLEHALLAEFNDIVKKKKKIQITGGESTTKPAQSAEEVGRAAIMVAQKKVAKNNVIDLRKKSSKKAEAPKTEVVVLTKTTKRNTIVKTEPVISAHSTKGSIAVSKKPENTINRYNQSIEAKRPIPLGSTISLAAKTATALNKINSTSNKRLMNTISSLNTRSAIAPSIRNKKVDLTTKIGPQKARVEIKSNNVTRPLSSLFSSTKAVNFQASPARGLGPECPVCFDRLLLGKPTVAISCGHLYCRECIDVICANSNKCPMCRVEIGNVIDLHL